MKPTATHTLQNVADRHFQRLISAPTIAIPTVLLFVACLSGIATVSYLTIGHRIPLWLGPILNGLVVYFFFSVTHDSAHGAICKIKPINNFFGHVSLLFFGPIATLSLARWIHSQHHRFTNVEAKDPDFFGHKIDAWMPLRWLNFDYFYTSYFLRNADSALVKKLLPGLIFQLSLVVAILSTATWFGYGLEAVLLWLVPSRISSFLFVAMFVYLPHAPFSTTAEEDEFQATSIRMGWEWLLAPLMTFQNYHLVHHLYPGAPFYRMIQIWNARIEFHMSRGPYIIDAFETPPPSIK